MLFYAEEQYFQELLEKSRQIPVLVDFYAAWCAPCRALESQLDALSDSYAGHMAAYAVNTDTEEGLVREYAVKNLPTVILLQNGDVVKRWETEIPVAEIEDVVKND